MAITRSKQLKWAAKGVTESFDGSQTFRGAMLSLSNIIPAPQTADLWVPRPASVMATNFTGFSSPQNVNALLTIGNLVYGVISETSGTYSGKDVPFAFNLASGTFETIAIPQGAASLPTSPASSGDWTPPCMAVIGSRIIICHSGYAGVASGYYFGWLDISGFSDTSHTGNTHSNKTINNLSANVLQAGWQVGMNISDAAGDIPANTVITSIASGGLSLTISNNTTGTNVATILTVGGGSSTAPVYAAGNTNLNPLFQVPLSVFNFNGRAYYSVPGATPTAPSNGVVFSDSGFPCNVTAITQAITFNNALNVTAFGGIPFYQSSGAVLQALVCFQGDADIQQITGDQATSNLAVNDLSVGVGTLAPNTICNTPAGLAFVAPDGLRILNFIGEVSPPLGDNGSGIQAAFLKVVNPTRTVASFNQNVMRISLQNGNAVGAPVEEYWYDFTRKIMTGPHTFPAAIIKPYQGSPDYGFVIAPAGVPGKLFTGAVAPGTSDSYVENGSQMGFIWNTILLPDNEEMAMNAVVESTIACAIPPQESWGIIVQDDQGNALDTVQLSGANIAPAIWGAFNWGEANWGTATSSYFQKQLYWTQPLVFKQASVQISGDCALGLVIGPMRWRYQELEYLMPVSIQ